MELNLNKDQRRAVTVDTNAVVSAGAGSGKTSVLTSRYIRLVVEKKIPVSRILALTFTRKAAAEMYERIYGALVAQRERAFVADQLARFDDAFIGTVDSFCGAVARDGCARYGVPPSFVIDEQALRSSGRLLSLQFLREHAGNPGLAAVIRLNGFERTWDALSVLATEHVGAAESPGFSSCLPRQEAAVVSALSGIENSISSGLSTILSLDSGAATCVAKAQEIADAVAAATPFLVSDGVVTDSLREPQVGEAAALSLEKLMAIKLTCGASKREEVLLLKEVVTELKELVPLCAAAFRTLAAMPVQRELFALLDRFGEQVRSLKQTSGLLSYHDVVRLAIRVLQDDQELRAYYKGRFDAIMIDEFQDNNEEQKQLLYLLAERSDRFSSPGPGAGDLDGTKLFFVGDEKQSIYRFRGADVSVFRTLAAELDEKASAIALGCNYRSEPGLIRFFNTFFASVFAGASEPYEARFLPLEHRQATPDLVASVSLRRVLRRPQGEADTLEDADAQAYYIAAAIRDMVDGAKLPVGSPADGLRPVGYRDIAILLKSSSNQIRLERMLRLFGIPYVSQSVRSLFLEAPANDIYQILQLALYPQDRVAYAGYLRSPLAGLSDNAIARLLLAEEPALFPEIPGLVPEDQRRLARARARWEEIRAATGRPITELLHIIWYRWGYRYHLLRREDYAVYLEYYDLLWELAHSFEERGLPAFLDEVRDHLGRNERLPDLDFLRADEDGVQIMTIHKSKGLEFPVVIAAYTENTGQNSTVTAAPFHWLGELGPAFNIGSVPEGAVKEKPANYLYAAGVQQSALEQAAELKRLLYVAATRAENHLIFFGTDKEDDGSLNALIMPAFATAEDQLASDAELSLSIQTLDPVEAGSEYAARFRPRSRTISDLAIGYGAGPVVARPIPREQISVTELNRLLVAGKEVTEPEDTYEPLPIDPVLDEYELAPAFGTLCHLCIEHAPPGGYQNPPLPSQIPEDPTVLAEVSRKLSPLLQQQFVQDAVTLANRFLHSQFWRTRGRELRVEHEVPFLLRPIKERRLLVRGKIDLILSDAKSVQVIDFKSDRRVDPDHYALQLFLYRSATEALYALPVSVSLFDLRAGVAVPVDTNDFQGEMDTFLRNVEIDLSSG